MTPQQKMKIKLETIGLPFKEVEVYGNQIVISCHCNDTAEKWRFLLSRFAKVRGVVETFDEAKKNKGDVGLPTMVKVWRTFAAITQA